MILVDVNILLHAHRRDSIFQAECADIVDRMVAGPEPHGLIDHVICGFIRIATNAKAFKDATPSPAALRYADRVRHQPHARVITPGTRHWGIFSSLCRSLNAQANLVTDAWLAALAIENDSEWVSCDNDFRLFAGLRWRNPVSK